MRKSTKVYAVAALAGGSILATAARANAQDAGMTPCSTLAPSHVVTIAGSTASPPIIAAVAAQLKAASSPINIVYFSPSSCNGLKDVLMTGMTESTGATYMDGTKTGQACYPGVAGMYVDVGVSDVFPQTCVDYSNIPALTASQKDWTGPIQAMVMAVQGGVGSTTGQTMYPSISAEAAYLVFGFAGSSMNQIAPWTIASSLWIRKPTSGTESMIAKAIGLPPTKWLAQDAVDGGTGQQQGGSGAVVTMLEGDTNTQNAMGILSTQYVDQNRSKIHALAFQAKDPNGGDQECGYLPDSAANTFDKLNVRQGRYGIWGPLHFVTQVDSTGKPAPNSMSGDAATDVQTVIQWLNFDASLTSAQTLAMIQASAAAFTVPPCAMEVSRMQDGGGVASQLPASGVCGCYYEALSAGTGPTMLGTPTTPHCSSTCTTSADCADAGIYKKCNYGYCEVQ